MRQFLEVAGEQSRAAKCAVKNEMRGRAVRFRREPLEESVDIHDTDAGPRGNGALIQKRGAPKGLPRHLDEDDGVALRIYSQRIIIMACEESRDVALVIDRHRMSHPADWICV